MHPTRRLVGPIVLLATLAVWQLLWLRGLPEFVLSPVEVVRHFVEALVSGELIPHVAASLVRSLPGFALGTAIGVGCGLLAGVARGFDQMLSPVVFLTYPVPKIVMLPLFMLWFGIGDLSKVLIIALACFYPTFINAYSPVPAVQEAVVKALTGAISFRGRSPVDLPSLFAGRGADVSAARKR